MKPTKTQCQSAFDAVLESLENAGLPNVRETEGGDIAFDMGGIEWTVSVGPSEQAE